MDHVKTAVTLRQYIRKKVRKRVYVLLKVKGTRKFQINTPTCTSCTSILVNL